VGLRKPHCQTRGMAYGGAEKGAAFRGGAQPRCRGRVGWGVSASAGTRSDCTLAAIQMDHAGHCSQETSANGQTKMGLTSWKPQREGRVRHRRERTGNDLDENLSWNWSRVVTCRIRTLRLRRLRALSTSTRHSQDKSSYIILLSCIRQPRVDRQSGQDDVQLS
jgi:hypothetical protein